MTELNTQLLGLLGEMKKEITAHRDHYDQKTLQILGDIDFLGEKLRQDVLDDEILDRVWDIDVDKYRLPN